MKYSVACVALLGGLFGVAWAGQPDLPIDQPVVQPDQPAKPAGLSIGDAIKAISQAEPVRRAGLKASLIRQTQRIIPAVVIVHDAESYLDAISSWEGPMRFPILWDDGSAQAREDIARFVRAFRPQKVLEYRTEATEEFASDRHEREKQINSAMARALSDQAPTWQAAFGLLRKNGIFSPGVVVTDATDDSWAAALALAAGRVQPIVFLSQTPPKTGKEFSPAQGDQLEIAIERAVEAMGFQWREIGDEIDAITLALNIGTRIGTGDKSRSKVATADRIGRTDANGSGVRWAYSGQIIGNESAGVYQAMCSLFLEIDSAFLWDGYTDKTPWSAYDMTATSRQFEELEITSELHDQPYYKLENWRRRMTRPVDASLILINSKGSQVRFDLPGGGALPGDLPVLERPSIIHMVHSFSMQTPTDERTIGGRLLSRGVYAYAGSVDEPFLNAFVPTPMIARRLGGTINFAAAVRYDDGDVWKIAVLGDPLVTVGSAGVRGEMPTMGGNFVDISERVSQSVKAEDFALAFSDLVMLGRDHDAARLAVALMKDRPEVFSTECAKAVLPALFRNGSHESVINAFERLSVDDRKELFMQDLLWFSGRVILMQGGNARVEAILRANFRQWQLIGDAEELAIFIRRRSLPDALAMLESFRQTLPSAGQREKLDRTIKRVRGKK